MYFFSGKPFMKNRRSKILLALFIYFLGFATAIYGLAPADETQLIGTEDNTKPAVFKSFTKSDEFANKCGSVLKNWAILAEGAVINAGEFAKEKITAYEIQSLEQSSLTGTQSQGSL